MSHVPDERLYAHASRVKDRVVIITGGANGIGKEAALRFASNGAKVVIGDLNVAGAQQVVAEIEKAGGTATCIKCNVANFDEQLELFELAMKKYGSVDVVVPNAGVSEVGHFQTVTYDKDGRHLKPNMKTLDVNLFGVMYTAHLATHYLQLNKKENDLKALIMIGSMASWEGIPLGEMYTASKHAVLGLMRSLHPIMEAKGIRVGCIHPFFVETGIVPFPVKLALAGIPLTPVHRVAGAIFYAATDPDMATSGSAWLLTDDGPLFMVPKEEFKLGVYKMIDDRANAAQAAVRGIKKWYRLTSDLWRLLGKPIAKVALVVGVAKYVWDNRAPIENYIRTLAA